MQVFLGEKNGAFGPDAANRGQGLTEFLGMSQVWVAAVKH